MDSSPLPSWVPLAASTLNGLTFAPVEYASTQSKSAGANLTSFRLLFHLARTNGIFSLWNGSGWYVTGNAFSRGLWLLSYDRLKRNLLQRNWNPNFAIAASSYVAGVGATVIANPIWVIKSLSQLPDYPGLIYPNPGISYPTLSTYRRLIFTPRLLMSGVIPAMGYIGIESCSHLFIYESLLNWYRQYYETPSSITTGLIGGISRVAVLPFTYPLHVVTLRYRENMKPQLESDRFISSNQKASFIEVWRLIHRQKAWYNGLFAYTTRVLPQAASLFFFTDLFRKLF